MILYNLNYLITISVKGDSSHGPIPCYKATKSQGLVRHYWKALKQGTQERTQHPTPHGVGTAAGVNVVQGSHLNKREALMMPLPLKLASASRISKLRASWPRERFETLEKRRKRRGEQRGIARETRGIGDMDIVMTAAMGMTRSGIAVTVENLTAVTTATDIAIGLRTEFLVTETGYIPMTRPEQLLMTATELIHER